MDARRDRFLNRERLAKEIPQLKIEVNDWDDLYRFLLSNFGKNTFIFFGHNEHNAEIFETLGRLGVISNTDWKTWMTKGVVCFRDRHMLLGVGKKPNGGMKYKKLLLVKE